MALLKSTTITGSLTMSGGAIISTETSHKLNIGYNNTVSSSYGTAIGTGNTLNTNSYQLAIGSSNTVSSSYGTAIGTGNTIESGGAYSIAIGSNVKITTANTLGIGLFKINSTYSNGFFSKSSYVTSVRNGSSNAKSCGITLPASCGGIIAAYNASTHGTYTLPFAKINNTIEYGAGASYSSNHNLYWRSSNNVLQVYAASSSGAGNYYITVWYTPGP